MHICCRISQLSHFHIGLKWPESLKQVEYECQCLNSSFQTTQSRNSFNCATFYFLHEVAMLTIKVQNSNENVNFTQNLKGLKHCRENVLFKLTISKSEKILYFIDTLISMNPTHQDIFQHLVVANYGQIFSKCKDSVPYKEIRCPKA